MTTSTSLPTTSLGGSPSAAVSRSRIILAVIVVCAALLSFTEISVDSAAKRFSAMSPFRETLSSFSSSSCSSSSPPVCDADALAAGVEALKQAVDARRQGTFGMPFMPGNYRSLHPCAGAAARGAGWYAGAAGGGDIAFLALGASMTKDRVALQLDTWAGEVPSRLFRAYSDVEDPALRMVTLPELEGQSSYNQAQHRVLKGLQHALKTDKEWAKADFVMILGDDTYVNLPELRLFASQFNPDMPAMFGYMWVRDEAGGGTWPSGGGGMLMTRAAAHKLAKALYTPDCPFEARGDDMTLGFCCWRLGIPLVHSQLFDGMGEFLQDLDPPLRNPSSVISAIAIHRAFPEEKMRRIHALVMRSKMGTGLEG